MNKITLKALKGSIAKWTKIVNKKGGDKAIVNCPLCTKFHALGCDNCPVANKTGRGGCRGSPYQEWDHHHQNKHDHFILPYKIECKTCKQLAQKELEFLKSLLPKERLKK